MLQIRSKRNLKYHYSPLRYPGGKTFLFPFIDSIIKEKGLQNVTYVEPFAGGAGAALALLFLEKVDKIVINDLDPAIYAFWKAAITETKRFAKKIRTVPLTVKEWRIQKLVYERPRVNFFDKGFATFYLNRTNVSGILNGGPIGGLKQKGKWKMNARFNREGLANKIEQLALYRNRISLFNRDGVELVKDYLGKKNSFIYLDPPYYDKGATLYLNHYKTDDHCYLADRLNKHPNAYWVLTYDANKAIETLYRDRKIVNFSLGYTARESRRGKELMILSDAFSDSIIKNQTFIPSDKCNATN